MSLFLSISGIRRHCVSDGWLKLAAFVPMVPKSRLTAAVFETEYGAMARGEYALADRSVSISSALSGIDLTAAQDVT